MKKYALTLLFAFALAAMHGQDRGLPERLERSLDSMILDAMQIKAFPGAQLVIGDREGVLYARNYGYHDSSRKREPSSARTPISQGSPRWTPAPGTS